MEDETIKTSEQGVSANDTPVSVEEVTPVIPKKTKAECKLSDDSVVVLLKLKAGAYYTAQKTFLVWIDLVQRLAKLGQLDTANASIEKDEELKTVISDVINGTVAREDIERLATLSLQSNENMLLLVSQLLGVDKKAIESEYYPEDVQTILWEGIKLNGFLENLKK